MAWSNPIVGGGNTLIRQSIHSPDYVAGVSGWSINKDGSAEFNDVVVRGELDVVGPNSSYATIDATTPSDPARWFYGGTSMALQPTQGPDVVTSEGLIAAYNTDNGTHTSTIGPGILVLSPTYNDDPSTPRTQSGISLDLFSGQYSGLNLARRPQVVLKNVSTDANAQTVDFYMNGYTVPNGTVAYVSDTAQSGAFLAETVILDSITSYPSGIPLPSGRSYCIKVFGGVLNTVGSASAWANVRARLNNATGTTLFESYRTPCPTTNFVYGNGGEARFTVPYAATQRTFRIVLTIEASGGSTARQYGNTDTPRYFAIEDCGYGGGYKTI